MKHLGPLLPSSLALALAITPFVTVAARPAASQMAMAAPAPAPMTPNAGLPISLNGVQQTVLPNGLTVLTKEVHTAPVAYFSVWYKAGSVNEQVGQTGMSHLLEHMLFKGTTTRKPGEISALLQANGAQFNATTYFDRTNYFETLASDRLELAMALEADRMQNSLFDAAEHQKEMTVVRSEYEGGENNPGAALNKAVRLAAYQVHPYRTTTIGFRADIENISRDEMVAFYKKNYVPNNATIVIVGDFDTKAALAMVGKHFGSIPAKPITASFITPEPVQQGERRVIVRRAGTTKIVEMAFHMPEFGHPDRYAIDVMEGTLGGGRTARFFSSLVQSGLASSADVGDAGLRDPDLIIFDATPQPGKTNEEIEKALLAEIEKIQAAPISAEELKRVVSQAEAGYIFGRDSVQSQGSQLGENAMKGNWRYGETYLENLRRVTPADVQRVAQKYLIETNRTVGYFEPIVPGAVSPGMKAPGAMPMAKDLEFRKLIASMLRGEQKKPVAPSRSLSSQEAESIVKALRARQAKIAAAAKPTAAQTRLKTTIRANAQMKANPMAMPMAKPAAPASTRVVLPNGITVVVRENHANPTVALSGALLSAGGVFEPVDKPSLAAITASQLSRGTKTRSLLDIARTLEGVGASANVSGGEEYASISGRALTRDFDTMLDVLADQLRNPSFPSDELEKSKAQTLAAIEQARQSTGALAQIAYMNAMYPVGHPYHQPTLDEQAAAIRALTRTDLVAFHAARYAPDQMVLTVVGDVDPAKAIASIQRAFGSWAKKGDLPKISIADVDAMAGRAASVGAFKPLVVTLADKTQADVLYGYPAHLRRTDPDFYRVQIMNTMLGSGLASRLALNVRDKLGLVYGISASTDASLGAGPFTVRFGSNPANVDKAVAETRRQLTLARDAGFTPAEVTRAIDYITGSYAVTLSTNTAVASQLLVGEIYGLGADYIQKRNGYYRAVTADEVNAAAKKYLDPSLGTLVISGSYPTK